MPESRSHIDIPKNAASGSSTAIDLSELMSRVGGDRELLRELCEVFATELPGMVNTVQQAIEAGNCDAIARAAHGLKGAVSVFGKGPAFDAALMVETAARNNRLEETRPAYQSLLLNLESLKAQLKDLTSR